MSYAKDSSKRWDVGAKDGSGSNSSVVLPLNRYLDGPGSMSVRLVHESGPARIDPVKILTDLDVPEHFSEGVKAGVIRI